MLFVGVTKMYGRVTFFRTQCIYSQYYINVADGRKVRRTDNSALCTTCVNDHYDSFHDDCCCTQSKNIQIIPSVARFYCDSLTF